ncbi:SDR family NAD(P)-dependent oxidoreductase [Allohahella marinimesophila]|uniref:SDR family oxidoreductase n=1 Tax=Allohahella marinimesophila TaxID=1054972 RepID=A0ABP7Q2J6_9GAMM
MSSKIAIVTGGSRGLGRNTVQHLAQRGADVILTYHSEQKEADEAVAEVEKLGGKALAFQLDTGDSSSFEAFADQVRLALQQHWQRHHFDFLVNNAGMGMSAKFVETTEQQVDALFNVHFKGVFFLTQKLLPLMVDGGRIINLSSGLARFSLPGNAAYGAMKGAIDVLTRYMALELGPRRITVNSVAPGAIETDFGGGRVRDNAEINEQIASQTALGRVGMPDDIGALIATMLGNEHGWINGQRIEASGGIML